MVFRWRDWVIRDPIPVWAPVVFLALLKHSLGTLQVVASCCVYAHVCIYIYIFTVDVKKI